jgi:hypothetical protein
MHYHLVSMSLLLAHANPKQTADLVLRSSSTTLQAEQLLERYALDICGIAFTSNSPPVLVNAVGPRVYCEYSFIYGRQSVYLRPILVAVANIKSEAAVSL